MMMSDLHLNSPQPTYTETMDMRIVHHMICLFTSQLTDQYQIILLVMPWLAVEPVAY